MTKGYQRVCRKLTLLLFVTFLCALQNASAGSWQNNQTLAGFTKVHLYTPDSISSIGEGRALLIVLHGCVQSIDAYKTANLEIAAENNGMVIAVPDAMNKAGYSCWSYWEGTKSRTSGDYKNLITLANVLSSDSGLSIDPAQVYIAGLSSGASFANTTGCLAPDVFAGMGISAGPSIGTSSNGALGPCESADVAARCTQYAGSYGADLASQIASIAQGDQDTTVNQCYNQQNSEGMAAVYGVSQVAGSNTLSEGSGSAEESLWQNGRVSKLVLNGVDHAWSGGQGASGAYISSAGINYADYLGRFFAANNNRVSRNLGPTLQNVLLTVNGGKITVNGTAEDTDGSVAVVTASFTDLAAYQTLQSSTVDSNGDFVISSSTLGDDLYLVTVLATDNEGKDSTAFEGSIRIGPPPANVAPQLSQINVIVSAQCATVSGQVVDANQDLLSVTLSFDPQTQVAQVSNNNYSATQCGLAGGEHTATVTAVDQAGLSSIDTITFSVDAGKTATLAQHINAGRLDYTNYANCYLEYSTQAFKLNEVTSGASQCLWQDDDGTCQGPLQACNGSTGGGPVDETCNDFTSSNYSHKVAGRAFSTGNPYAPDYFAQGTNTALSGSTWGSHTLNSTDNSNWSLGSCP
ncbi:MAG: poly(3-hydroxybutyrate) depolymerase [Paraglaciecola sp.]|jgi:poly(3-hydroxybutyrate) depolymerase